MTALVVGLALAVIPSMLRADEPCSVSENQKSLIQQWGLRLPDLIKGVQSSFAEEDPYIIYNLQMFTNNLLRYAAMQHDVKMITELSLLYLMPYRYLQMKDGHLEWLCGSAARRCKEAPILTGQEVQLNSAQYLFLIAQTIHFIANLRPEERTPAMKTLAKDYLPVMADFHNRLLFGKGGFSGCDTVQHNHAEWIKKLYARSIPQTHPWCNAVSDLDLWLIAAPVEILAAHRQDPQLVPLGQDLEKKYLDYIADGTRLIESRMSTSQVTDFKGQSARAVNFDLGSFDGMPGETDYSGYTGESPPTLADRKAAQNTGWDISHARRFVQVFDTLYDNRDVTGQSFPDRQVMEGLANEVLYKTFNRDFKCPLFTNYMDGTNGWYRVGYNQSQSAVASAGVGPYQLSAAIATGGYGFWSRFNPDMHKVLIAICEMYASKDPAAVQCERKYYAPYVGDEKMVLLELLPTLLSDQV